MLYPGRIVMPMNDDMMRERMAFWKTSSLFMNALTEPAKMTKPKDFVQIEDMDEAICTLNRMPQHQQYQPVCVCVCVWLHLVTPPPLTSIIPFYVRLCDYMLLPTTHVDML